MKMRFLIVLGFMVALSACASDPNNAGSNTYSNNSYQRPGRTVQPRPPQKPNIGNSNASSSGLMDPMEAHLRARRQVDPNDTRTYHSYTSKTTPYESSANSRTAGNRQRDTSRSVSSVPAPPSKPFSQSSAAVVASSNVASSNAIMPPRKPITSQTHTQEYSSTVKPLGAKPQMQVARKAGNIGVVKDVRIGSYHDKTRVVFDMDRPISFSTNANESSRSMVIHFARSNWEAQNTKSYPDDRLLSAYKVSDYKDGPVVSLTFKQPVRLVSKHTYPPNDTYRGYRAVFDFVPQ